MRFKKFWYESNSYWGEIKNTTELIKAFKIEAYECSYSIDDFLDNKQNINGADDFGSRMEHTGIKTLREFLKEQDFDFKTLKT